VSRENSRSQSRLRREAWALEKAGGWLTLEDVTIGRVELDSFNATALWGWALGSQFGESAVC
jgi:hypothetical protein